MDLVAVIRQMRFLSVLLVLCLASTLCLSLSGCAVGGRNASIDSNSRIPFFGLELHQRKRKLEGPPIHSIRWNSSSNFRTEPLRLVDASKSPIQNRDPLKQKTNGGRMVSLPLPRTDTNIFQDTKADPLRWPIDFR